MAVAEQIACECGCGDAVTPGRRFISGHNRRGADFSAEHRARLSVAMKESRRGVPLSDAHREAISRALRGRPKSPEQRVASGAGNRGKVRTPEQRTKISGPRNPQWRGDEGGYRTCHVWLDAHYAADKTECEDCGATAEETRLDWAYRGPNGGWSRQREDYRVLCSRCHRAFDREKEAA